MSIVRPEREIPEDGEVRRPYPIGPGDDYDYTLSCDSCLSTLDVEDIGEFRGTCAGIKYNCPNCGMTTAEFVHPEYLEN